MTCLGISGGLNRVYEDLYFNLPPTLTHDSAAALCRGGRIATAIEEERLNRIKHSNKFPSGAIRHCLKAGGIRLEDVDKFGFYMAEHSCDMFLSKLYMTEPNMGVQLDARTAIRSLLQETLEEDLAPERLVFVRHHYAHAMSAVAMSGFEESLVLVVDGFGDAYSGIVAHAEQASISEKQTFPLSHSIGHFYINVIHHLGYGLFDEYKVMALAPHGDPGRYRSLLGTCYELLPGGRFAIDQERVGVALFKQICVRKVGGPFTQEHKDMAASLQEALTKIVFHVLRWHRRESGLRNLCLAGGVAHNCSMNGEVLYSGLFDDVFVQPAAHDAGCAVGAALVAFQESGGTVKPERLRHTYWGTHVGEADGIRKDLDRWSEFLSAEKSGDVAGETARLLVDGAVVGWVQGRSEFGPRALGNRSILADPRFAENRERINSMVKKREAYRPFAPSVLEEDAAEFFELPEGRRRFPFMNVVVKVQPDRRHLLGATTHIDGTARLQTVSRDVNPGFWRLIKRFKDVTGVPVLLNTSFNNNVEPIVDSVEDAIVSFLTNGLDYLVVGDYIVSRRSVDWRKWLSMFISIPEYVRIRQVRAYVRPGGQETRFEIKTSYKRQSRAVLSKNIFQGLLEYERGQTIGVMLHRQGVVGERREAYVAEVLELWGQRLLRVRPTP